MTPGTRKMGRRQNSSILSILAVFVGYRTQFFGSETISTARDPRYTKIGTSSKLVDFVISGSFNGQLRTVLFGSGTISTARDLGYTKLGTSSKLIDFVISGSFRGLQHTVFFAPGRFQLLVTAGTREIGRRQNSSILSILAVFVGYRT